MSIITQQGRRVVTNREKIENPDAEMNAREAADILGVNRRRHDDLREMVRARLEIVITLAVIVTDLSGRSSDLVGA